MQGQYRIFLSYAGRGTSTVLSSLNSIPTYFMTPYKLLKLINKIKTLEVADTLAKIRTGCRRGYLLTISLFLLV